MDIIALHVICKKGACGHEVSREQHNNYRYVTAHLLIKYGAVKHFMTKNLEGESDNPKYSDVQ